MGGSSKKGGAPDIPAEKTFLANPISHYKERTGSYPSNAQTWWTYRRPPEPGTQEPPKLYLEVFDPALRHQMSSPSQQTSRGHYMFSAFHIDRSAASGYWGLPVESTPGRPSTVAFYAGRAFWAGVPYRGWNTKIYFSQIIERIEQAGKCFQELDPTDEDFRDLLPSDGGIIVIPEVAQIVHLQTLGQSLIVFATNGIWQITGSEGIGFRANDYAVSKIASTGDPAPLSFVNVEGVPMWWSKSGIWALQDNPMGAAAIQSLSDDTIKTFFDKIPAMCRMTAKGAYNPVLKRVQWVYRESSFQNVIEQTSFDRILNFDLRTQAFWPYTPSNTKGLVEIKGVFSIEGYQVTKGFDSVVVNNDPVLADLEEVVSEQITREPVESIFKYPVDIKKPRDGGAEPLPDQVVTIP